MTDIEYQLVAEIEAHKKTRAQRDFYKSTLRRLLDSLHGEAVEFTEAEQAACAALTE